VIDGETIAVAVMLENPEIVTVPFATILLLKCVDPIIKTSPFKVHTVYV
jgi:hypothetical protein